MQMKEMRNANGLTLAEFLAAYDVTRYDRPSVTADTAVFTLVRAEDIFDLAVLLVRRGDHPEIGKYALPGGFVNMDEELEDAALRELAEETGLSRWPIRQFHTFGTLGRDVRTRVITAAHYSVVPYHLIAPRAGDDAAEAGLFVVETSLEAKSASAETYRMTLFGKCILTARARLRYDMLGSVTAPAPGGDLAGDHAHVLFTALCALSMQPRERIARLLTLGRPDEEAAACEALDRALCEIPAGVII